MPITRTNELILTVIFFWIVIILQLIQIFSKKKDIIKEWFWELRLSIKDDLSNNLSTIIEKIWELRNSITDTLWNKFSEIFKENRENSEKQNESINKAIDSLNNSIKEKMDQIKLTIDSMTEKVDSKLQTIQKDNTEQLEKMRQTVDEKLQNTLEKRLWESFKLVSERLEEVHKWLWEMQNLATWVWDLKKVLSNVKTRWNLWEIQLEQILEQFLSPEQYDKNVKTKPDSRDLVEFAIKLPWKEDGKIVYIPVDAKFPLEKYHCLVDAYEIWDPDWIKLSMKELETSIKNSAKDIRNKYISVPNTTDFWIMFLPIEWLYAEVVRSPELLEYVQKDLKIMVAWPTTLVAMLNSLQMWFRTLAIEKRSSEVWNVLWDVKTEFEKFWAVLEKAQKKIKEADQELDNLVTTRTNKMNQKLNNISKFELPK